MAKTRLLGAICTVAMLAGAPAFAQTNRPTGDTGAGGAPNNPTNAPTTAPAPNSYPATESHSTHRHSAMRARNDLSQDSAVNRLNDESYQAAQKGQAFTVGGSSGANDTSDNSSK
jgi:hypothetical protein